MTYRIWRQSTGNKKRQEDGRKDGVYGTENRTQTGTTPATSTHDKEAGRGPVAMGKEECPDMRQQGRNREMAPMQNVHCLLAYGLQLNIS